MDLTNTSRRDWLKTVGAVGLGLLGAPALATADDLKAKAHKNIKLGIMSGVYGGLPVAEAARKIASDGFSCVVCDFTFADARFDPLAPDWKVASKITGALEAEGVRVVGMMGYYNVIDPDTTRRKIGEARMKALLTHGKKLGTPVVAVGTGTFNASSEWGEAPENATEEAFLKARDALASLARTAEKTGATVAIEAYWKSVVNSIDRAERLFHEVDSPALKLVMDPCNFYRKEDLSKMQPILEDMFRRLGKRIAIAHAKDVTPAPDGTGLPAAGLGVLDYPLFLRRLAGLDRPIELILEHLQAPDVDRALGFVKAQFDRI
jgi:sugar phosphate isomerase/epimerase